MRSALAAFALLASCRLHPTPRSVRSASEDTDPEALADLEALPDKLGGAVASIEQTIADGNALLQQMRGMTARLKVGSGALRASFVAAVKGEVAVDPALKLKPEAHKELEAYLVKLRDTVGGLKAVEEDTSRAQAALGGAVSDASSLRDEAVAEIHKRATDPFASVEARGGVAEQTARADAALAKVKAMVDDLQKRAADLPGKASKLLGTFQTVIGE